MPSPSGDEDGDAGTLPTLAYPIHRCRSGGGKPPPPRVHPMQHSGPPADTERQSPRHSSVQQGSIEEEAEARGGGSEGEHIEGIRGIQGAAVECNGFSIPGRVLTAGDDDWLEVVGNLGKSRKSWGRLSRILSWEGAATKVPGHFTKRWRRWC